jgi:hypothetical protein
VVYIYNSVCTCRGILQLDVQASSQRRQKQRAETLPLPKAVARLNPVISGCVDSPRCSEQSPAATAGPLLLLLEHAAPSSFSSLELAKAFHLLENVLKQLFPSHDVEVTLNLWILAREAFNVRLG